MEFAKMVSNDIRRKLNGIGLTNSEIDKIIKNLRESGRNDDEINEKLLNRVYLHEKYKLSPPSYLRDSMYSEPALDGGVERIPLRDSMYSETSRDGGSYGGSGSSISEDDVKICCYGVIIIIIVIIVAYFIYNYIF